MRLTLASRKSDLAKIQALTVADELKKQFPHLEISHHYRESLGDVNLTEPLWRMPERGVFTEDFVRGLIDEEFDAVVHSWKDLPTEPRVETEIISTLPREDVRDLLLLRADIKPGQPWRILSSSPRRAENLQSFFKEFLPLQPSSVEFVPVRGNVPRRIEKLFEGEGEALIVAKAALDRLLADRFLAKDDPAFAQRQALLSERLRNFWVIVLPLELNPPAAAQGALAIEIKKGRADLAQLFHKINCLETFENVRRERAKLREFGGGCHLKIGVVRVPLNAGHSVWGHLEVEKGMTPAGERFSTKQLVPITPRSRPKVGAGNFYLCAFRSADFFTSETFSAETLCEQNLAEKHWHIAHSKAVGPELLSARGPQSPTSPWTWASGLESWKKLVRMGFWIRGSDENLGTDAGLSMNLETLTDVQANESVRDGTKPSDRSWTKISHDGSFETARPISATYRNHLLQPEAITSQVRDELNNGTLFYWHSTQLFEAALALQPDLAERDHACGPGQTRMRLETILGRSLTDRVFLSEQEWRDWCASERSK